MIFLESGSYQKDEDNNAELVMTLRIPDSFLRECFDHPVKEEPQRWLGMYLYDVLESFYAK